MDIHSAQNKHSPARRKVLRYLDAQRIPAVLNERFLERIEPIRLIPLNLLEVGSAAGHLRSALSAKYPATRIISIEQDKLFCLNSRSSRWRRLFHDQAIICASPSSIPLPSASIDMVCANLCWTAAENLHQVLNECARVLRAPGLLMMVACGPQTLSELREVWSRIDRWEHTHRFVDMHDVGDAMVAAGLSDVVVDSERLTVEFDDIQHMLAEVRAISGGHHSAHRRPGLTAASVLQDVSAAYPDAGGFVAASLELVFAHAWMARRPGTPVSGPNKPGTT